MKEGVLTLPWLWKIGKKYPDIRAHLEDKIGKVYKDMDVSFKSYPDDNTVDPDSCAFPCFWCPAVRLGGCADLFFLSFLDG